MSRQRMKRSHLGQMLVLYRASTGANVRDTAAAIGTSAATLSRIERGHQPDLATWRRIESWLLGAPDAR